MQSTLFKMESTIKSLSERFNLSVEFLTELHDKIVDKENFTRAVRMFMDGLMPYDIATGKEPINVAELRPQGRRRHRGIPQGQDGENPRRP